MSGTMLTDQSEKLWLLREFQTAGVPFSNNSYIQYRQIFHLRTVEINSMERGVVNAQEKEITTRSS